MSSDQTDLGEPLSESFDFFDTKDAIVVTLYANGSFQTKDVDVCIETDSLEVRTPMNERWFFQLYDQVYKDQAEYTTTKNSADTQTSIEIRIPKQQKRNTWPQLYTYGSTPITPPRYNSDSNNNQWHDCDSVEMTDLQSFDELLWKNVKHQVCESKEKVTVHIHAKKVVEPDVKFTETNFTVTFRTSDESFLKAHNITGEKLIKIVVRTKERLIPELSSYKYTGAVLEVALTKDNPSSAFWNRVDASEYLENQTINSTPPSSTPPSSPISTANFSNNSIPLPPPCPSLEFRKSDKTLSSTAFNSAIEKHYPKQISSNSSMLIGYTGIHNPANSCFMNAAVQCLSNTRELRDYFLNEFYKSEINRTNPLGMKGVMAEEFGILIKNLWLTKHSWVYADKLRDYVAKRHQEFVGNGQHDAQELLTILLDAIHEDLNRVINKPLVPPVEDQGRADQIVAEEYWRGYLSRNNSIIVQLFTGQFKSKTKCPVCHRESLAFDPFTSISVPVLKRTTIETIVTFRSNEKPPMKYRIVMSSDGLVSEFKKLLSAKCGLETNKMIVFKVRSTRNLDILKDDERLTTSSYSLSSDTIHVAETLTSAECNNEPIHRINFVQRVFRLTDFISKCGYCEAQPNPHGPSKYCNKCYQVFYCDETCLKLHASDHKGYCGFRASDMYDFIGTPFIISLPESKLTYENVLEQIQINVKRTVDIEIGKLPSSTRMRFNHDRFDDHFSDPEEEEDEEETFSDVENIDWKTMKTTLSSSDSWSICRLGDYFVKNNKAKRRRNGNHQQGNRKEKHRKNNSQTRMTNGNVSEEESMSDDEWDIFTQTNSQRPLFRLMPMNKSGSNVNLQAIVEPGDEANRTLHRFSDFSIDWFTDNKREAPLRVSPSKNYHGINGLLEHESVTDSSNGDLDLTLQQCLQMFIEPEVLGPDDKWYCPTCKEHIQAEKKMSVWRLPPILIIHLKRFKYYHGNFGYLSDSRVKIDTHVKFPIHNLDMSLYCSSEVDCSQSLYDLFGVINHRGSAWFGHYTSYGRLLSYNDSAKTEIGWRNFDDEHVSTLSSDKEIVRSDAYVLFYRQRNVSVDTLPDDFNSSIRSPMSMDLPEDFSSNKSSPETEKDAAMDDIHNLMN